MTAAIEFDRVVKEFRYFTSPMHRLWEAFDPLRKSRHVAVPVLRDVSFSIGRGEAVAVIGPNGVGKSTLLHIIAGLLEPSSGRATVNGRVKAILDLGGTFLPDLTGRENVRFFHDLTFHSNGHRPHREGAIEAFADIGEFFDRPVRTYSSGLFLRLAFAAAIAEDPDVLLIDEVLAVGDARFQQKCFRRIRELRDRGTTIVLVTHLVEALPAVCDRVLVLEHGQLIFDGDPGRGVDRYYQLFFLSPDRQRGGDEHRYGTGGAKIESAFASRDGIHPANSFAAGETVRIVMDVSFQRAVEAPQFGFSCSNKEGIRIYATTTAMLGQTLPPAAAEETRRVEIDFDLAVTMHDLFIDLSLFEVVHGQTSILDARLGVLHLEITRPLSSIGITDLRAVIRA